MTMIKDRRGNMTKVNMFSMLLVMLSLAVPTLSETGTFKVRGELKFPKTGVYTHIPAGSCLYVSVKENIQCDYFPCDIPEGGNKSIHNIKIVNNFMNYEVESKYFNSNQYAVSAVLNIGWCRSETNWIQKGDYKNEFLATLDYMSSDNNETIKDIKMNFYDLELCGEEQCNSNQKCSVDNFGKAYCHCPTGCENADPPRWACASNGNSYISDCHLSASDCFFDSVTKVSFGKCAGTTTVPTETSTTKFTTESTVTTTESTSTTTESTSTTTKSTAMTTMTKATPVAEKRFYINGVVILPKKGKYFTSFLKGSCLTITITYDKLCKNCTFPVLAKSQYKSLMISSFNQIEYRMEVSQLRPGAYNISATVNIGWCRKEKDELLYKQEDYFTGTFHGFSMKNSDIEKHNVNIMLVEHQKYMCGSLYCYKHEKCVHLSSGKVECRCPYACADVIDPTYVCANNGQSYTTECWMKSTDCFSGTVWKVKDGKCGSSSTKEFFGDKQNIIAASVGGVALILILLVFLCVCRRRNKEKTVIAKARPHYEEPKYASINSMKKTKFLSQLSTAGFKQDVFLVDDERVENVYVDMITGKPDRLPPPYEGKAYMEVNLRDVKKVNKYEEKDFANVDLSDEKKK